MKIVFIARFYPPIISGAGRRLSGIVEGLRQAGAEVFIVAPQLESGEVGLEVPHPMAQPLPPTSSRSPAPVKDFVRRWARVPDADIKWTKAAAAAFIDAAPFTPDWVFTSAPPESIFAAGKIIKQKTGAKWASDFRDHWLTTPHDTLRTSPGRRLVETQWAKRLSGQLDAGFAVNEAIADEFQRLIGGDISLLPHFVTETQAAAIDLPKHQTHLVHTGRFSLSDSNCSIQPLLDAFEKAVSQRPDLRLHLVGALSAAETTAIADSPAAAHIMDHGVLPYSEALGYQAAADGLILVLAPDAEAPPSKLVEYLAVVKPVLICGPSPWRDTAGRVYPGDEAGMIALADTELSPSENSPKAFTARDAGQQVFDVLAAKT